MGNDPKLCDIIDSKVCNLCAQNTLMSGIKVLEGTSNIVIIFTATIIDMSK